MNANVNGITLKSIKNRVTFHFDKKSIKTHIGNVTALAIVKASVGVILVFVQFMLYIFLL
jgi:hypothetical protein